MVKNLGRGTFLGNDAVRHIDHMARNIAGKRHLVGHHDHRQPVGCQLAHNAQHLAHHLGVQRGGRLVKQQHLRLHRQGAGDRHALLLPAGKLARLGVDIRRHTDLFQILQGGFAGSFLVLMQHIAQPCGAVVQHGHIVEQVKALEHHTHLGAVGAGVAALGGDVLPVEQHLTVGRGFQQVDAAQQGGLAAAGCADHTGDIAGLDGKIHIAQHNVGAEALGKMLDLNNSLRHGRDLPSYPDSAIRGWGRGRCTSRWCRREYQWCSGRSSADRPAPFPTGAAGSWPAASSTDR